MSSVVGFFLLGLGLHGAHSGAAPTRPDSVAIYSGVYASSFQESIFSACDVPGIGSGWWLRFNNPREGVFLKYQYASAGMPTIAHFIRVRGRLSAPGQYGLGFQNRELVVDSVLEVSETPQLCTSYEDLPQPWAKVPSTGSPIIGVAMSRDNSRVAVFDLEGMITIRDTRAGSITRKIDSGDKGEYSWGSRIPMEFTPDGRNLAVGGSDGVLRTWNAGDGTPMRTLISLDTMPGTVNGRKMIAPINGVTFNRSGSLLASMAGAGTKVWSMQTGNLVGSQPGGWGARFLFIGDSSFMASGDSGLVKIYPRLGAEPIWRIRTPVQRFDLMERSADGQWLFTKSWGDTAYLWSLSDGQLRQKIALPGFSFQPNVAFSPDGKIIAAPANNGLYLWETATGKPIRSFQKYRMGIQQAWFTPDGRSIISYSMSDTVLRVVHLSDARTLPAQLIWPTNAWLPDLTNRRTFGSVAGFVRDSAGRPIIDANVSILDGDHPASAPILETSTNAAGRFLVQGLPVRHVIIRAMKRGYLPELRYQHLPAEGAAVEYKLKRDTRRP